MAEGPSHETDIQTHPGSDKPGAWSQSRTAAAGVHPNHRGIQVGGPQGRSAQEVFVVTSMSRPALEQAVLHHRP